MVIYKINLIIKNKDLINNKIIPQLLDYHPSCQIITSMLILNIQCLLI